VFTARYGLIPYIKQITFRPCKVNTPEYSDKKKIIKNKSKFISENASHQSVLNLQFVRQHVASFKLTGFAWNLAMQDLQHKLHDKLNIGSNSFNSYIMIE